MGRQPPKSPVVIDLVDSDSDIEIIHHTIVVLDDEAPPKPSLSRSTLQQVCRPIRSIRIQALTVTKRGIPLQQPLAAVKVEDTPLPIVKVETTSHSFDSGDHRSQGTELDLPCGWSTTDCNETDSDTVSEVDDKYSHARVCGSF